jgi:hypothetical protein
MGTARARGMRRTRVVLMAGLVVASSACQIAGSSKICASTEACVRPMGAAAVKNPPKMQLTATIHGLGTSVSASVLLLCASTVVSVSRSHCSRQCL